MPMPSRCNAKHQQILRAVLVAMMAGFAVAQQPKVHPGPEEPDWSDLLAERWNLDMKRDLRNPLVKNVAPAALFKRVNASRPVTFTPILALGMKTATHAGWYKAGPKADDLPADVVTDREKAWSYAYKHPKAQMESGEYEPVPLAYGKHEFDPGDATFGLWVSNDEFDEPGVFTQPALVAKVNPRLADQPYKAMIYPTVDPDTGRAVADSYLIGWEYSTNDDFQDIVTRIDNVRLLPGEPMVPKVIASTTQVKQIGKGFRFIEGPAWDFANHRLLFSDVPYGHIMKYADGEVGLANPKSGQSNGLMLDAKGRLIACEHANRRVSVRSTAKSDGKTIVDSYEGKKLNSPNDLWLDADGGIYFSDPRYGNRDNMEMEIEGVYYIAPDWSDGKAKLTRVIDDLVRPNGLAVAPDGKTLYVVDNGRDMLWRYPIEGPGQLGEGEHIGYVVHPDGMSVDKQGQLYITSRDGVSVHDADGKFLGVIPIPEQPTNCTFGGKNYRRLFVTARSSLHAVDTRARGWHVHLDGVPGKKNAKK